MALSSLLRLKPATEGDRVTTLELFFDLVCVFAFTQVTGLMADGAGLRSVVEGTVVFCLLWWTWCSYAWLYNTVRGDQGLAAGALVVVMVTMFVACMAIPQAFSDRPGGLDGPVALAVCYLVVRLIHNGVYLAAAGSDRALRRQVVLSLTTSALPAGAALIVGAVVGEPWQLPIWLVAVLYDLAVIFVTSRGGGGWTVPSGEHFAERHGLIAILALGESIVAIGAGVAQVPLSWTIAAAAALAIGVSVAL